MSQFKEHFNHDFYNDTVDDIPSGTGDRYWAIDLVRDFQYQRQMAGLVVMDLIQKVGRGVTTNRAVTPLTNADYTHITFAAQWSGYAMVDVEVPDDTTIFQIPQDKKTVTIPVRIEIPAVSNLVLATLGFVADGSRQYLKARYDSASVQTRTRQFGTGTYSYNLADSYELYIDAVAPTVYDILIAYIAGDGSTYLYYQPTVIDNVMGAFNPNRFVNGSVQIFQRAASGTVTALGSFIADMIRHYADGTFNVSWTNYDRTLVFGGDAAQMTFVVNSASGQSSNNIQLAFENAKQFSGKVMTFSMKTGGNNEATLLKNCLIRAYVEYGTGGSPTASAYVLDIGRIVKDVSPANSVTSFTFQMPDIETGKTYGTDGIQTSCLKIIINLVPNTTGTINFRYFKLEDGAVATPHVPNTYEEDLAMCQRYYEKSYNRDRYAGYIPTIFERAGDIENFFSDNTSNQKALQWSVLFKTPKRVVPTVTIYSSSGSAGFTLVNGSDVSTTTWVHQNQFRVGASAGPFVSISVLFFYTADASF